MPSGNSRDGEKIGLAGWVLASAFLFADMEQFSIFKGASVFDLFIVLVAVLIPLSFRSLSLPRGWYWVLGILSIMAAGMSMFNDVDLGALQSWALQIYLYLLYVPVVWFFTRRDLRLIQLIGQFIFLNSGMVGLELLIRIVRNDVVWWSGPAIPLLGGLGSQFVLAFGLIFGLQTMFSEWICRRRLWRMILASIVIMVVLAALGITLKRSAWLGAIFGIGLFTMFVSRTWFRGASTVLALAILAAVIGPRWVPETIASRVRTVGYLVSGTGLWNDPSFAARREVQTQILSSFGEGNWTQQLFGFGYGRSSDIAGGALASDRAGSIHNAFLSRFAEAGVVGGVPFTLFWGIAAVVAARKFFRFRRLFHQTPATVERVRFLFMGIVSANFMVALTDTLLTPSVFLRTTFFLLGAVLAL